MPKQKRKCSVCRRLDKQEKKLDLMYYRLWEMSEEILSTSQHVLEMRNTQKEAMKEGPKEEELTEEEEARLREQQKSVENKECTCPICRPNRYAKPPTLEFIITPPHVGGLDKIIKAIKEEQEKSKTRIKTQKS